LEDESHITGGSEVSECAVKSALVLKPRIRRVSPQGSDGVGGVRVCPHHGIHQCADPHFGTTSCRFQDVFNVFFLGESDPACEVIARGVRAEDWLYDTMTT